MSAGPQGALLRALLKAPILVFRARIGWIFGGRLLLLETIGRTSGLVRRTVIEVARGDRESGRYWVVAGWGRSSDWYLNALAHPPRLVDTGRERFVPEVRELDLDERRRLLTDYQRENPRVAATLGRRLLGSEFSDDPDAIARLAAEVGALELRRSLGASPADERDDGGAP